MTRLFVGCYTPSAGRGSGIGIVDISEPAPARTSSAGAAGTGPAAAPGHAPDQALDRAPAAIAASAPNPSFLAWHPHGRVLYSVNEVDDGAVSAFGWDGAALHPVSRAGTGGGSPCHLAVDPTGGYLVTANYGSGSVAVHALDADGRIGPRSDLVQLQGSGPVTGRQDHSHAHMVLFTAGLVLVPDLGADRIAVFHLEGGRLRAVGPGIAAPAGFGPRHAAVLASGLLGVTGELAGGVGLFTLGPDGSGHWIGDIPASAQGFTEPSGIGAVGEVIVAANRGVDTVATFRADDSGELRVISEIACGGSNPRDLTVVDDRVFVANQASDEISLLRVGDGELSDTGIRCATPSPTQVLPRPTLLPRP